ncbi:unnamed protein product [Closterium sp. Yama58-4]|nr:unnamed protein product [Closterium sp. Yama58-4]
MASFGTPEAFEAMRAVLGTEPSETSLYRALYLARGDVAKAINYHLDLVQVEKFTLEQLASSRQPLPLASPPPEMRGELLALPPSQPHPVSATSPPLSPRPPCVAAASLAEKKIGGNNAPEVAGAAMEEAAMPEAGVAVNPAERVEDSAPFEAEAARRTGALTGGDCTSHSPFEEPSSPNAGASPPAAVSLSPDSIREPARPEAECQFAGNTAIGGGVGLVGAPCAAVSPDGAPNDDAVPPTSSISPDTVVEPVCSSANRGPGGECAVHSPRAAVSPREEPHAHPTQPTADSSPPDSMDPPDSLPPVSAVPSPSAVPPTSTVSPVATAQPDSAVPPVSTNPPMPTVATVATALPPVSELSRQQPVPIDPLPHPKLKNQWREAKAEASRWWLLGERHVSCVSLTRGAKVEAFDPVDFHFPKAEASGGGEGSGRVGGKQGGKDGGKARGRPPKWSKTLYRASSAGSSIVRFGTKRGGESFWESFARSSIVRFGTKRGGDVGSLPREWAAALIPLEAEGKVRLRGYVCSAPPCLAMFSEILLTVRVYVQECCFQKLTRVKERAAHALYVCTAAHITTLLRLLELRPTRPAEFTPADFNRHTEKLGFTFAFSERQAASKRVRATAGGGESNEGGEEEAKSMTDEEVNRYVGVTTNNQALPEMEPPPGVTSQLRCYQKQALHWMLSMETMGQTMPGQTVPGKGELVPGNGQVVPGNAAATAEISTSSCSGAADASGSAGAADGGGGAGGGKRTGAVNECDALHPCWEEYMLQHNGGTPFYHNVFSGEVTLEFPSAMERSRGGILADAMGLGKTVMTIALIAASKANRERGKAMARGTMGKLGGVAGKMDGGEAGKQVRDERRERRNGECAVANGAACKEDGEALGGVKRKREECSAVAGAERGVRVGSRRKKRVKREVGEGVMQEAEAGIGEGGDAVFLDHDEDEGEQDDKDEEYLPGEEGDDGGGADAGSSDSDGGGADSDAEVQEVGGETWRAEESPEETKEEGGREVEEWNGNGSKPRDRRVQGGTLIVCPMSLLSQWKAECEAHTAPGVLSVMVYYGSQRRDFEARFMAQHDVVITTYGTLQAEYKKFNKKAAEDSVAAQQVPLPAEFLTSACTPPPSRFNPPPPPPPPVRQGPLHSVQWCRAVLDEAHFIKNRASGAAAATFALQADARWCLTGTPIQVRGERGGG